MKNKRSTQAIRADPAKILRALDGAPELGPCIPCRSEDDPIQTK
jgi:hypothetical protein